MCSTGWSSGATRASDEQRIEQLDDKTKDLWGQKLDDWGNPLRPANLNRGVYKGGRRPLDIYWRIAKGITGAQMPSHYPGLINEKQVWDLVNFVLALPYEPELAQRRRGASATSRRRRPWPGASGSPRGRGHASHLAHGGLDHSLAYLAEARFADR